MQRVELDGLEVISSTRAGSGAQISPEPRMLEHYLPSPPSTRPKPLVAFTPLALSPSPRRPHGGEGLESDASDP